MDLITAIKTCFKKSFEIHGRAIRSEFWFFHLFWMVFYIIAIQSAEEIPYLSYFSLGVCIISLIPYFSVSVRRMHDLDRSGWSLLLALVPIVGGIIILVMFIQAGTNGKNKFGKNPLKISVRKRK